MSQGFQRESDFVIKIIEGVLVQSIDIEKPELKAGEFLCDGCWAVASGGEANIGWQFFNFKYLKAVWICPTCRPAMSKDLMQKQAAGL